MIDNSKTETALVFHYYRTLKAAAIFNYGVGELNRSSALIDVEQAHDSAYKLLKHLRRLKIELRRKKVKP